MMGQNNTGKWAFALVIVGAALFCGLTASAEEKIVVEGFRADNSTMSLRLSGTALNLSDDNLDPEGNALLGGATLSFRWSPVVWLGVEASIGGTGRTSENGLVEESRGVASLAGLWYFSRHRKHRFYGVFGLASVNTNLLIGNEQYQFNESGPMFGIGTEWLAGKSWVLSADLRAVALSLEGSSFGGEEEGDDVAAAGPPDDGIERNPFPARWSAQPEERIGMMFNFGVGYRW